MGEISTTETEIYIGIEKITGVTNAQFERMREFVDATALGDSDKIEKPTFKSFTFTLDGNMKQDDTTHTLIASLPDEPVEITYYPNGKASTKGFKLPVYVEKYSESASVGDLVKFNAGFKTAGPAEQL